MAMRHHHYDAACEEYLRSRRIPYVAVDETRRALLEQHSLKSFDFIVYSSQSTNLLVEVKGRRFPTGNEGRGARWENWASADDLPSLLEWERVFGPGFRSVLVFAYDIVDLKFLPQFPEVFSFRDHHYAFFGVWASDYLQGMRCRSASWQTVNLPRPEFHRLRWPLSQAL